MPKKKKRTYDKEFMRSIGSKGGKNSTFRYFRDRKGAASKAGSMSKRGPKNDSDNTASSAGTTEE